MVAGCTFTAHFQSGETWRFEGLVGEKGPLIYLNNNRRKNHPASLDLLLGPWEPQTAHRPATCFHSPGVSQQMATDLELHVSSCLMCQLPGHGGPRPLTPHSPRAPLAASLPAPELEPPGLGPSSPAADSITTRLVLQTEPKDRPADALHHGRILNNTPKCSSEHTLHVRRRPGL